MNSQLHTVLRESNFLLQVQSVAMIVNTHSNHPYAHCLKEMQAQEGVDYVRSLTLTLKEASLIEKI